MTKMRTWAGCKVPLMLLAWVGIAGLPPLGAGAQSASSAGHAGPATLVSTRADEAAAATAGELQEAIARIKARLREKRAARVTAREAEFTTAMGAAQAQIGALRAEVEQLRAERDVLLGQVEPAAAKPAQETAAPKQDRAAEAARIAAQEAEIARLRLRLNESDEALSAARAEVRSLREELIVSEQLIAPEAAGNDVAALEHSLRQLSRQLRGLKGEDLRLAGDQAALAAPALADAAFSEPVVPD